MNATVHMEPNKLWRSSNSIFNLWLVSYLNEQNHKQEKKNGGPKNKNKRASEYFRKILSFFVMRLS
jgi:hypothetical protein